MVCHRRMYSCHSESWACIMLPGSEIMRKSGTWRTFHSDSGIIERDGVEHFLGSQRGQRVRHWSAHLP